MIRTNRGMENGLQIWLSFTPDPWTRPDDNDGITPKQRESWSNDNWFYVNAIVTVLLDGIEVGSASYPGIEFGTFLNTNENDEITGTTEIDENQVWAYVGNELAGQAIEQAYEFSDAIRAWRVANPTAMELRDAARESA